MRLRYFLASLFAFFFLIGGAIADEVSAPFACSLQGDRQTVRVTVKNGFGTETHCRVDCQFSTQRAGTSFQISCGRTVQPGNEAEICVKHYEKEPLVAMTGGGGFCVEPLPAEKEDKADGDDEAELQKAMKGAQDLLRQMQQK